MHKRILTVAAANDVLDLEVLERSVEAELLDDAGILAACQTGVVLGLGTSDNHLAAGEDEGGGLGLTNAHDDGSKALGVVLGIASVQSNGLQVKPRAQVDSCYNVLKRRHDTTSRGRRGRHLLWGRRGCCDTVRGHLAVCLLVCSGCVQLGRAIGIAEAAWGHELETVSYQVN